MNGYEWEPLGPEYNDFRYFLKGAWEVLGLPRPTPAQYRLAYFLQNSGRRRGIQAFRGIGKSWISSVLVCYCLRHNPQYKFLIVSASKERADNFTMFTRQLIDQWDILHCLIPSSDQRDSRLSFDVRPATPDHAPSVKSVGITGQLSGSRADEIIGDDIEVSNNSETQLKREKLVRSVSEFDSILKPNGYITMLGTPQTEESVYTTLGDKGFEELIYPSRYPAVTDIYNKYRGKLDPELTKALLNDHTLVGKPTDPARFSDDDLDERERSIGKSRFALQFQLDTSLSDAMKYPLRLSDLIVTSVDRDVAAEKYVHCNDRAKVLEVPTVGMRGDRFYEPMAVFGKHKAYTGSAMYIDPSGRGTDETAYAVVKQLNSQLFIPAGGVGGLQGGYEPGVLEALCNIAKENKVNTVIIESNMGDGMFTQLLKPYLKKIHPVEVLEERVTTQKELRIIDTLEPVLNSHRLVVDKSLIAFDAATTMRYSEDDRLSRQFFYQLTRLTKDRNSLKHDDRLDALSSCVRYWINAMAMDADERIEERVRSDREALLESFLNGVNAVILTGEGMSTEDIKKAGSSVAGGVRTHLK